MEWIKNLGERIKKKKGFWELKLESESNCSSGLAKANLKHINTSQSASESD